MLSKKGKMSGSTKKCNDLVTPKNSFSLKGKSSAREKKNGDKNFQANVRTFEKTLPVPDGL